MSKAMKRKHVQREEEDIELKYEQEIVKILSCPGSNLHEVENSKGDKFLVSLPTKFRKNIWIKRGDFVIIEPIKEGDKVKAEIIRNLRNDQIKDLKLQGLWPECFNESKSKQDVNSDTDLFVNTNRYPFENDSNDSDTESSDG